MSRKGNCWDNAPTESWFGSFKNESVYGERFETQDEVITMTFEYIEVFYNRKRLHSTLGYKSPMRFPDDCFTAQQQEKTGSMKPASWKTKNRGKVNLSPQQTTYFSPPY